MGCVHSFKRLVVSLDVFPEVELLDRRQLQLSFLEERLCLCQSSLLANGRNTILMSTTRTVLVSRSSMGPGRGRGARGHQASLAWHSSSAACSLTAALSQAEPQPNVPSVPVPTACSSENRALSPPAQHVNSWPGALGNHVKTLPGEGLVCAGQPGLQQEPPQGPEGGTVMGSPLNSLKDSGRAGTMPGRLAV